MDVDRRYYNHAVGTGRYANDRPPARLPAAERPRALDYVRYRHTDSDLYRVARQQLFVKAVKQQSPPTSPCSTLPRIVKCGHVTTSRSGRATATRFDAKAILDYALFAYGLPAGHVFQSKIDIGCYQGYNELTVADVVHAGRRARLRAPRRRRAAKATAVALQRKRPTTRRRRSQTSVTC